ncbi:MAG: serine/threonine-protein kinase [Acidobacteriota bacterium]
MEPADRPGRLEELCAGEPELRRKVEGLLEADARASGFLEGLAAIPEKSSPWEALKEGERLGPYRLLRQIGEGGMGTVFLAERADGSFDLQVAVKVLRHGTEGRSSIERFERERQILAQLNHPNIARLLDGGTTESGLPYVVMEYVDGEPIDRACERRALSAAARVDLMIEVCDAVTAAHRSLVVHRDLKPANILIAEDGKPRLLDFGIAKLLDPGGALAAASSDATASHARRLTPTYASPEQLRGDPITVATDVYLLGVVLYEILTGRPPFRFPRLSLIEIERTVTRETPDRPSEVAPGLSADLDAIALMALRGDPRDRYGSAEALADDLRRYRQDLPVRARRGSWRYAAGKTVRRHWPALAVALLFAVLLGAFSVSTALQAQRLERSVSRLTEVHGVLVELFAEAEPQRAKGDEISLTDLLRRGEKKLELGLYEDPGTRGLLHSAFGRLALHTGQLENAREHLEAAIQREEGEDFALETGRVRALSDLALTLSFLESEEAEAVALEALAESRSWASSRPELRLEVLNVVASLYCWQRRWQDALPMVEEARGLVETLGERPSRQTAEALALSALLAKNLEGDLSRARAAYERALAIFRRLEGEIHPEIANILNQLGNLDESEGLIEKALERHERALEVRGALYPEGHWEVAQSQSQVAILRWSLGDLEAAESAMLAAWDFYSGAPGVGPSHNRTIFFWIQLAEIRLAQGRDGEAEAMLGELSEEWWASRKPTSQLLSLARRARGCLAASRGRTAAAERDLEASLPVLEERHGGASWEVRVARSCLESARGRGRA